MSQHQPKELELRFISVIWSAGCRLAGWLAGWLAHKINWWLIALALD